MKTLRLPNGRQTTRIGFGCAHLVGAVPWAASRRLLDHAFACGIRHFDVAPMYGFADAERLLGAFIACHAGKVTVTTKFGIVPQKRRRLWRAIRTVAKPIFRRHRSAGAGSAVAARSRASARPPVCFDVDAARRSIEKSLRMLRTEHIDLLLLHEATADDLQDDRLLGLLDASVASGKIGAFGVGSERDAVLSVFHKRPAYCSVAQHRQNLLDLPLDTGNAFKIYHGMFGPELRARIASLQQDPDLLSYWSQCLAVDLSRPNSVSGLVASASIAIHSDAMWLIASSRLERIESNCTVVDAMSDVTVRSVVRMLQGDSIGSNVG